MFPAESGYFRARHPPFLGFAWTLRSLLPAAEIEDLFRCRKGISGETCNGVYDTAVVLWDFLSQVPADGKMHGCDAAVARVTDSRTTAQLAFPNRPSFGNTANRLSVFSPDILAGDFGKKAFRLSSQEPCRKPVLRLLRIGRERNQPGPWQEDGNRGGPERLSLGTPD